MDLDDELRATRKLHKVNGVYEDLEYEVKKLYRTCKTPNDLNKMSIEISKISFKECSKRKKELKDGVYQ